MRQAYDTVIGLEVHVQLNTTTKAFSSERNSFEKDPNTNISAISIALPGVLPRANVNQVRSAIKLGLTLDSAINQNTSFDRKNYFYPDSPKGYQITQDTAPIVIGGQFTFKTQGKSKTIRIHHAHMEDDAGKSIHTLSDTDSMIDLNRAGTPLLEVVTEPDFSSGQEVSDFLAAFQNLLRYIEISDANMEEGSLRCDCNVSVKPAGQKELGTRCEIKNINSKKFAKTAISYERDRQIKEIEAGHAIDQETRLFDSKAGITYTMRKKEDALDYRYFPDPDLQTIVIEDQTIADIQTEIDFLPWTAEATLLEKGVSATNAAELSMNKNYVIYFITLNHYLNKPKLVSNFIINQIAPRWAEIAPLNQHTLKDNWVKLLQLIEDKKVSPSAAYQTLVPEILKNLETPVIELAQKHKLLIEESTGDEIPNLCATIIKANPDKVKAYQKGKKGLIGFFMGQAMRSGKKYDAQALQKEFEKQLAV